MNRTLTLADQNNVVTLEVGRSSEIEQRRASLPIVRIHLLGSMRATTYLGDNVLPRGKKARAILGYLCLASEECVPRARLAAMLWDRVPDASARTSFRQGLRELSCALGSLASEIISVNRDALKLNSAACWIDARAALTSESFSPNSPRSDLAVLCRGDLLEDLDGTSSSFDQWLRTERAHFSERLRFFLEGELDQVDRAGVNLKQLAAIARRLLMFDPTHEGASRVLMRALADMGERAQAIREYARCRETLKKTLDVEPSSETRALYEAIRMFNERGRTDNDPLSSVAVPLPRRTPQKVAPSRDRLRVGVLPFLARRSANEENLAFSLSQEISAALARFRWFDVIAPVSLVRKAPVGTISDHQLHNRDLDYVVDGTVSGNGKYYQISVRLLDLAEYARPVWSDCFKLAVGELHRLNELVTTRIVARIDPVILSIEGQPKRRERYGATGLLLLAIPLIFSMERKKYEDAGELIRRALEIDPDNAMVAAWAAHWHLFYVGQGWSQDSKHSYAMAQRYALAAIKLDPDNAEALGIYAHACSIIDRDFDSSLHYFDRSLRLNPSLAFIWALSAMTQCYIGEPTNALQRLGRYSDLAPFDPYFSWFESFYTIAYTFKGDYERAAIVGRRATKVNSNFVAGYKPLIASLGHLGRTDEARPYIDKLLSLEPGFTVERFGQVYPIKHASDRERYLEGLRRAGVPER